MPKWFVLGVFLAAVAIFVPALIVSQMPTAGHRPGDIGLLVFLLPLLAAWAVWFITHGVLGWLSRPRRSHTLFTPLYEQR